MKNPSLHLKMRVLGAIDLAPGRTIASRIKNVAAATFTDEDGHERRFIDNHIYTIRFDLR